MTGANANKTVLVVDDQENFLDAVAFEFEIMGMKPLKAKNGIEGFEIFKAKKDEIEMIISDIRMPVCDGGQFLDKVRSIAKQTPPFVFMTGFADLKPAEAYDRGADAFVGKPLKPNEVKNIVDMMLCTDDKKWLEIPTNLEITESINKKFSNFPSSDFQIGKSGFFISYASCPGAFGIEKDSVIEFDLSFNHESFHQLKGLGKIVWLRMENEEKLLAGCGVMILSLDVSCRDKVIKFLSSVDELKTIPKGESF